MSGYSRWRHLRISFSPMDINVLNRSALVLETKVYFISLNKFKEQTQWCLLVPKFSSWSEERTNLRQPSFRTCMQAIFLEWVFVLAFYLCQVTNGKLEMCNGTVLQQAVGTKAELVSRSTYSLLRNHLEFFAPFLSTGTFHSNSVIVKAYTTALFVLRWGKRQLIGRSLVC